MGTKLAVTSLSVSFKSVTIDKVGLYHQVFEVLSIIVDLLKSMQVKKLCVIELLKTLVEI